MESLQTYFDQQHSSDIHTIGRYIQQHVDEQWQPIFEANKAEMIRRYPEIGDTVYGIYGTQVFKHIHNQLSEVALKATPRSTGQLYHFEGMGRRRNRPPTLDVEQDHTQRWHSHWYDSDRFPS